MLADQEHAELAKGLDLSGEIAIVEDILNTPAKDTLLEKAGIHLVGISLLYVIFTSGTTGVPKSVITSHESLIPTAFGSLRECFLFIFGGEESYVLRQWTEYKMVRKRTGSDE